MLRKRARYSEWPQDVEESLPAASGDAAGDSDTTESWDEDVEQQLLALALKRPRVEVQGANTEDVQGANTKDTQGPNLPDVHGSNTKGTNTMGTQDTITEETQQCRS